MVSHKAALAIFGSALLVSSGCAREVPAPVTLKAEKSVRAMVESVDPVAGTALLRGEKGGAITLKARPGITGFSALKPGDHVNVKLLQAVSVELGPQKHLEAPSPAQVESTARARLGDLPEGASVSTTRVEAQVVGIDRNSNLVVLKKPDGELAVVRAGEKASDLDKVQPGDVLSIDYSQSVLVEVPPRASSDGSPSR